MKLAVCGYVPGGGEEVRVHILGTDVGHLISTIGHNLQADDATEKEPFFKRKVLYDNLPTEARAAVGDAVTANGIYVNSEVNWQSIELSESDYCPQPAAGISNQL